MYSANLSARSLDISGYVLQRARMAAPIPGTSEYLGKKPETMNSGSRRPFGNHSTNVPAFVHGILTVYRGVSLSPVQIFQGVHDV